MLVLIDCVAERGPGVCGVLALGESSSRAGRVESLVLLTALIRPRDNCLFKGDGLDICAGIVSGGRSLGDGGRVEVDVGGVTLASFLLASFLMVDEDLNAKCRCFQLLPGTLADLS